MRQRQEDDVAFLYQWLYVKVPAFHVQSAPEGGEYVRYIAGLIHLRDKKADACRDAYTQRMEVCVDETKARRAVEQKHEYVNSEDKQVENQRKGQ